MFPMVFDASNAILVDNWRHTEVACLTRTFRWQIKCYFHLFYEKWTVISIVFCWQRYPVFIFWTERDLNVEFFSQFRFPQAVDVALKHLLKLSVPNIPYIWKFYFKTSKPLPTKFQPSQFRKERVNFACRTVSYPVSLNLWIRSF